MSEIIIIYLFDISTVGNNFESPNHSVLLTQCTDLGWEAIKNAGGLPLRKYWEYVKDLHIL